ncbi:MAG: leucine-rich repeat domain-containing protein, partial [Ruminococcus sp.]|nr:leucine-rich repeat domain-containing protein [Ruminococcus sp.]
MNIRGIIAGIIAVCFVGGVMPSADVISDNTVITAGAVDEAEYTEGTYELVKYKNYGDHIEISGCDRTASEVVIPSEIDGLPVTSIEEYMCCSLPVLTSLIIPDSVTSIGYGTFTHCPYLRSVIIPDSVTSIGGSVFYDTPWLENKRRENPLVIVNNILIDGKTCSDNVVIPEGVTSICGLAFSGCTMLKSIKIPESVTSIGSYAFFDCSSLTSVTIPDSVTNIEYSAFFGCTSLSEIDVDINNPKYSSENGVVFDKDKTTLLTYPSGKKGKYMIPDSVTSINFDAFFYCSSLTSVTIPD